MQLKRIEGTPLGMPGRYFYLHKVEGNSKTFLLIEDTQIVLEKPVPALLAAISEITGYPDHVLRPEMKWEEDLGISELKRKKIAALLNISSESIPKYLGAETIGEWSDPKPSTTPEILVTQPILLTPEAVSEAILRIVSEKTGYPADTLDLDAALEADLGIDSIKQAQIAIQIQKTYSLSIQEGVRIKDFPTLKSWIQFILQPRTTTKQAESIQIKLQRSKMTYQPLEPTQTRSVPEKFAISPQDHVLAFSIRSRLIEAGATEVEKEADTWIEFSLDFQRVKTILPHGKTFIWIKGEEGPSATEMDGAISGFVRTLALEYPDKTFKMIEMDRSQDLTETALKISEEILHPSASVLVNLTKPSKRTLEPRLCPISFEKYSDLSIHSGSLILVSGGLGGIGQEIIQDLDQFDHPSFLALGSRETSHPEVQSQLDRLKKKGIQVFYESVDLTCSEQWEHFQKQVLPKYPKITGIIHAAGIIRDRGFENKDEESFKKVYSVKVTGMDLLTTLIETHPLRFFTVFSSVSGRFGNPGQTDYAAANAAISVKIEVLRKNYPDLRSFSIVWGPWLETGMAKSLGPIASAIFPQEGVKAFRNELFYGGQEVEIIYDKKPAELPNRTFDLEIQPWLNDHRIGQQILLPASIGLEWMEELALGEWEGSEIAEVRDFKIHNAIHVDSSTQIFGDLVTAAGACFSEREVWIRLQNSGQTAFESQVILQKGRIDSNISFSPQLPSRSYSSAEIYSPKTISLGPSFQPLEQWFWDGKDEAFGRFTFRSDQKGSPIEASFHTAALIQLFGQNRPSIPHSFQILIHHRKCHLDKKYWVHALCQSQTDTVFLYDLLTYDSDWILCTEIRGFRMISTGGVV